MKPKTKLFKIIAVALVFTIAMFSIFQSCKKEVEIAEPEQVVNEPDVNIKNGSDPILYFGHEIVTRETGPPVNVEIPIINPDFEYYDDLFTLNIQNGDGENNLVSSAIIKIDGEVIFGPEDFNQNITFLSEEISLTAESVLEVEINGIPGSYLDIWIDGELLPGYIYINEEGGTYSFNDGNVLLTIPPNALPSYGLAYLGVTGNEPNSVPNPNLEVIGTPMTLQLPANSLLQPIHLSFPKPSTSMIFENNSVFLFNGSTYFPMEFSFSGNNVIFTIDKIDWELDSNRDTDGLTAELIIIVLEIKQAAPDEWMGLNEPTFSSEGMSPHAISSVNSSSKIALFIHGWTGSPITWETMIPAMQRPESNLSYTDYWTFGYNSSKSIEYNGEILKNLLADNAHGAQIDIIAHSMGGLVSRSMIEQHDGAGSINRLVTLGSPHQGSPLAALRYVLGLLVATDGGPERYFYFNSESQGFKDLYTNSSFIQQMMDLDSPSIPYYTIACKNGVMSLIWYPSKYILDGPDDGIVSVQSAKGVQGADAPDDEVTILAIIAHTKMTRNEEIQEQVINYLSSGPTGIVSGSVVDAVTSVGISDVDVRAYQGDMLISVTQTASNGGYSIELPEDNNYTLNFAKIGYIPVSYYNVDVTSNNTSYLEAVLQIDEGYGGTGSIGGYVTNAINGQPVSAVSLYLREGINVQTGPIIATTTSLGNGSYEFTNIDAGNYTVEASRSGYITSYFSAVCIGGQTTGNQNISLTPDLNNDEIRIVLEWGATPSDLDSHLTGPIPNSSNRFHIYYANKTYHFDNELYANLDRDDVNSYGPETTTIYVQTTGTYRYSVLNFSNMGSTNSYVLSNSSASVKVYNGLDIINTFYVPNAEGTLWTVFEIEGNSIIPINSMSYHSGGSSGVRTNNDAELFMNLPDKKNHK